MTHHIIIGLALCAPLTAIFGYLFVTYEDFRYIFSAFLLIIVGIAIAVAFIGGLFLIFSV